SNSTHGWMPAQLGEWHPLVLNVPHIPSNLWPPFAFQLQAAARPFRQWKPPMRQLADIPHSAGTSPVVTRASCPHVSETCLDTVNIPVPFEQRTENRELREVTTVLSVKYFFCTLLLSLLLPSLASADFRINPRKRTKPT